MESSAETASAGKAERAFVGLSREAEEEVAAAHQRGEPLGDHDPGLAETRLDRGPRATLDVSLVMVRAIREYFDETGHVSATSRPVASARPSWRCNTWR